MIELIALDQQEHRRRGTGEFDAEIAEAPAHGQTESVDVERQLDAAAARAVRAGARLEGEVRTHRWGRIAHLADPFGHGVCLIQFLNRGYDEVADP